MKSADILPPRTRHAHARRGIPKALRPWALGLAMLGLTPPLAAHAAPVEAGKLSMCVHTTAASVSAGSGAFSARTVQMVLNSTAPSPPSLDAASVRLTQLRGPLDADALREAAVTSAAAALQQALRLSHPNVPAPCPSAALTAGVEKLQSALLAGGAYDGAWTGATLHAGGNGTHVGTLTMHADKQGSDVAFALGLHGITPAKPVPGMTVPSPQSIDIRGSAPADRIASALGGGLYGGETVPFTLASGDLALGAARFTLTGKGRIGATPQQGEFLGKLTASNFDAAIDAATQAGLTKLRTGLYLARLAARQEGDRLAWDLHWQQGMLFVNNVPLPIR